MNQNHSSAAKRAAIEMQSLEPLEPSPEMKRKLFARVDADLRAQSNAKMFRQAPMPTQSRAGFARPRVVLFLFVMLALLVVGAWIVLNRFF
jgi:hypothetical protein